MLLVDRILSNGEIVPQTVSGSALVALTHSDRPWLRDGSIDFALADTDNELFYVYVRSETRQTISYDQRRHPISRNPIPMSSVDLPMLAGYDHTIQVRVNHTLDIGRRSTSGIQGLRFTFVK
jgi:hypothetical protein